MNSYLRLSLVLLASAGLACSALAAADDTAAPFLIHLTSVIDSEHRLLFCDGDPESKVRNAVGRPDSVIGGSVWVYRRLGRQGGGDLRYVASDHACDTTLVAFNPAAGRADRTVREIVRVNSADVAVVAAAMVKDRRYVANRVASARDAAPVAPAPEELPFLIHLTAVVNYDGSVLFRDGDSEACVLKAVGPPSEILPGEVWAYRRYEQHRLQEVRQISDRRGCETTLVTFTPGDPGSGRTVTAIVMASPSSLAAIAECLKRDPDYLQKRMMVWHNPTSEVRVSLGSNR